MKNLFKKDSQVYRYVDTSVILCQVGLVLMADLVDSVKNRNARTL